MLVDTHCHLDFDAFDADRDAVVERALAAGVTRIVVPGIDLATSRRAVALAEHYPGVYAAVGVHPNSADKYSPQSLSDFRMLAAHPKVVGIGEIGIDFFWKKTPPLDQADVFRRQIELANAVGKPIIVHDRDAHEAVMTVLRETPPQAGAVLHAFSGDAAMAEEALAVGFYLGVDGPLTYKKSDDLRALFAGLPLERILIETDAPYLTPQPQRGKRNEPAYVRYVAETLALTRAQTLEIVAEVTTQNAASLFRWE
ncbi:MAG: TatD family hydrolase [Anaerolineales bacterium]